MMIWNSHRFKIPRIAVHRGYLDFLSRYSGYVVRGRKSFGYKQVKKMTIFGFTLRYSDGLQTERADNFIKYHMNKIEPC